MENVIEVIWGVRENWHNDIGRMIIPCHDRATAERRARYNNEVGLRTDVVRIEVIRQEA